MPVTASVQQMLTARCADQGCHGAKDPLAGLDLVSPDLEKRLVNVKALACRPDLLVVPGQPDSSLMVTKVTMTKPECGVRMPMLATPLTASETECLRQSMAQMPVTAVPDGGVADASTGPLPPDASPTLSCPAGQGGAARPASI